MAENSSSDHADDFAMRRREYRAARLGPTEVADDASDPGVIASDDAQVGAESMAAETTLNTLAGDGSAGRAPTPPGTQRSGDLPDPHPLGGDAGRRAQPGA